MRYKMKIEPITFIHIGSGQELGMFDYLIFDKVYFRLNLANFYSKLKKDEDKKTFLSLIDKISSSFGDDLKKAKEDFHKFISQGVKILKDSNDKQKGIIYYRGSVEDEVVDLYKNDIQNTESQFIIYESIRTQPDFKQYIPGSSIKGAFRTAILSYFINRLNLQISDFEQYRPKNGKDYEGFLLNFFYYDNHNKLNRNFQKDPFRAIKITDTAPFDYDSTLIAQTLNYNTKKNVFTDFKVFNECINNGKSSEFIMTIEDKFFESGFNCISKESFSKDNKNIKLKSLFNIKEIAKACNEFYFNKLEFDYGNYYNKFDRVNYKLIEKDFISTKINKDQNEFLLRIGRYSQFEDVTMDNLRDKEILISRNLVKYNNEYYPAGWAKITYKEEN